MKALVTGGVGFIGGHLAAALRAHGATVHLLDNFNRGVIDPFIESLASKSSVELIDIDLLHDERVKTLDDSYTHIYHLAAIIGVQHVLSRPYEVLAHNARMTINVIELAKRQNHIERLLFSSTSEVYAGAATRDDFPIPTPEQTPLLLTELSAPRTSYMLSKIFGEALCRFAGVPWTCVRLHNVYGPRMGMSHVIPELLHRVWKAPDSSAVPVASVDHTRTFCFVDDAVSMVLAAAAAPAAVGLTLNIGNQEPEVSIGELARLIVEIVGRNVSIAPAAATPGSPSRRCPDISLLRRITGSQSSTDLRQGLCKTFDWYREHVFSGRSPTAI
jgi:UDP-glucose 4-epimerase